MLCELLFLSPTLIFTFLFIFLSKKGEERCNSKVTDALVLFNTSLVFLDTVFSVSLFLCRSFFLPMLAVSLALAAITATSRPPAPPSGLSSPPLADPMLSRLCRAVSPRLRASPGLPVWVCVCVLGQRGNGRVRSGRLSALPSLGRREDRLALQLSD